MRVPPGFLDELRARLPVSEVVGRKVKLIRRGREFVACCPFHNEKTPSFTVNDDKAFFHCFGCGEHGDVIGFVMRHDGLSFPEAIEHCASLAGLTVPQEAPAEREKREKRESISGLMEIAAAYFEGELRSARGAEALDYARRRGLSEETIARWRLGYAPGDGKPLVERLTAAGASEEDLVELGLLRRPDDGRPAYPFFRNRLLFPVGDRRGRVVGFGGRLLSGDGPKYVNSPQTPLFDKGRLLFGYAEARNAAARGHSPIIAEGYMDVLALWQAGFRACVAPLGTALTEDQLALAWRLGPSPVLCFDGDEAGLRAAWRAAERALERLKPDHTVRFAFLPEGEDPDSLLQRGGAETVRDLLGRAETLDAFVWRHEAAARKLEDPAARAGLEAALDAHARRIVDASVSAHFRRQWREAIQERFFARTGTAGRAGPAGRTGTTFRRGAPVRPPSAKPAAATERVLLALILNHPPLYDLFGEQLAEMDFADADDAKLRDCLISHLDSHSGLDSEALASHVAQLGHGAALARLRAPKIMEMAPFAGPGLDDEEAALGWRNYWASVERRSLKSEVRLGARALRDESDERAVSRHRALQRAAGFDDVEP